MTPCARGSQYNLAFYMQYLVRWPEYFEVAETPSGRFMGYIMGKAEVPASRAAAALPRLRRSPCVVRRAAYMHACMYICI